MKESELQERIKALLDDENFIQAVVGSEIIESALKHAADDMFWPGHPVDYLIRLRACQSAKHVLGQLHELELVSDSRHSLSIQKGESMFSDLLCCNTELGSFVLFELKTGRPTSRQTVTEILAYEQELRNHCPFLSHDDISFVIISTVFPVTVDHALAEMLAWSRRRILCLVAEIDESDLRLRVHLPAAWSAIGQGILPADGVATAELCLYETDKLGLEEVEALAATAAQIISREADRSGSHGFVMVWRDAYYPECSQCPIILTVGVVNPFSFLSHAVRNEIISVNSTRISEYLLTDDRYEDLAAAHNWNDTVGSSAIRYLKQWCNPMWEGLSTWRQIRRPDRKENFFSHELRALPIMFEFFGVMGDHVRDITSRPSLREQFVPSTVKPGVDWRTPRLATALLEEMTMPEVVPHGQWTFAAFFELGIRLGRYCSIAHTYSQSDDQTREKLNARLYWAEAEIWVPWHSLRDRCRAARDLSSSPPTLVLGKYDHGRDVASEVDAIA